MPKTFILVMIAAMLIISPVAHSEEKKISAKEHKAITIALYKEIRALKEKGLLYNNCGYGACAAPELKAWFAKFNKHNATDCYNNGHQSLETTLDELLLVSDLFQIGLIGLEGNYDKSMAQMYKFESAMICYDNPAVCEMYKKKKSAASSKELKELLKLIGKPE